MTSLIETFTHADDVVWRTDDAYAEISEDLNLDGDDTYTIWIYDAKTDESLDMDTARDRAAAVDRAFDHDLAPEPSALRGVLGRYDMRARLSAFMGAAVDSGAHAILRGTKDTWVTQVNDLVADATSTLIDDEGVTLLLGAFVETDEHELDVELWYVRAVRYDADGDRSIVTDRGEVELVDVDLLVF